MPTARNYDLAHEIIETKGYDLLAVAIYLSRFLGVDQAEIEDRLWDAVAQEIAEMLDEVDI